MIASWSWLPLNPLFAQAGSCDGARLCNPGFKVLIMWLILIVPLLGLQETRVREAPWELLSFRLYINHKIHRRNGAVAPIELHDP